MAPDDQHFILKIDLAIRNFVGQRGGADGSMDRSPTVSHDYL